MHRSLLTNRNIIFVRLNSNNIMKIVYNKFIPFEGYLAINLFGVLFVRGTREATQHRINDRLLTHERIHTAQMKELAYIFFYLWYFVDTVLLDCFTGSKVVPIMTFRLRRKPICMKMTSIIWKTGSIIAGQSFSRLEVITPILVEVTVKNRLVNVL